jgi:DNA-binding winged helix-turn-helix (wHTH) protein
VSAAEFSLPAAAEAEGTGIGGAPVAPPAALVGQGPAAGERFLLQRPSTIIGRAEDCDIRLQDPLASRRHAEVRRESWRYILVDLGSRNGTRVNGQPVTAPQPLQHGDTILVASVPLRFEDPNATVPVAREALRQAHLPVWVDSAAGEAYAFGRPLELAPKELALLTLLFERAGQVCDKDEIAHAVWPEYDGVVNDYNIETLVSRLRQKLGQGGVGADAIVTVKKRGYRLARESGRQSAVPADAAGVAGAASGAGPTAPPDAAVGEADGPSGRPEMPTRAS